MSEQTKSLSNAQIRAINLSKLKDALDSGIFTGLDGQKMTIPLKADGTVARDSLAAGLGFARSAFQKVTKSVGGKRTKVESEFAALVDEYDQKNAGKSGSEWGGRPGSSGDADQKLRDLKNQIQKLERRVASLQLERDEANAKLMSHGYEISEMENGQIRLPW